MFKFLDGHLWSSGGCFLPLTVIWIQPFKFITESSGNYVDRTGPDLSNERYPDRYMRLGSLQATYVGLLSTWS